MITMPRLTTVHALSAIILVAALAATGCAGSRIGAVASSDADPSPTASPAATATSTAEPSPDPTAEPTSHISATIREGDCVHTESIPIGTVDEFYVVDCESSDATFKVVAVVAISVLCPPTAEYSVQVGMIGNTYCLSDQLTGVEVPAIDRTVAKGDCILVEGDMIISRIAKVSCASDDAQYKVTEIAPYNTDCKKPADTWIDLTGNGTDHPERICMKTL